MTVAAAPALEARGVMRRLGGVAVVDGVDLSIAAGEIVALVGLNGAGKTTLLRILSGMLRPDSGDVRLAGVRLDGPGVDWRGFGHLVDAPAAYRELTVATNLRLIAGLRGTRDPESVDAVIAEFALDPFRARRHRALSAGNRQRVGIAGALVHDPAVIVLDEPTNALDPAGVILLRESLRRRAAAGAAALVSSHHLDEVARIADRIVLMNAGRLIGELEPGSAELERAFFEAVRRDDEERT